MFGPSDVSHSVPHQPVVPDEVEAVVAQYGRKLLFLIRQKLAYLGQSLDEAPDLLQEVWCRYLARKQSDAAPIDPPDVYRFLRRSAVNLVVDTSRSDHAQKRDSARTLGVETPAVDPERDLVDCEPGPVHLAVVHDLWAFVLSSCDPFARSVLEYLRNGDTQKEAAAKLGCDDWVVNRVVAGLKLRFRSHEC